MAYERDDDEIDEAEAAVERKTLKALKADLKKAATGLTRPEVRYLVDLYYEMQENRIRAKHQARASEKDGEPNALVLWVAEENQAIEKLIRDAMGAYAKSNKVGEWLLSVYGIGPVIAAGFLAHLDITRAPTVGHFWSFAGLNPEKKWEKGQKRPWNTKLKTLCWKLGESMIKFSNKDDCFYGKLYKRRKELEVWRNDNCHYKPQAAQRLVEWNVKDKDLKAKLEDGKLPDAALHGRARRWTEKMFLSHLHFVMFFEKYGKAPPKPYVIDHLHHAHMIPVPTGVTPPDYLKDFVDGGFLVNVPGAEIVGWTPGKTA